MFHTTPASSVATGVPTRARHRLTSRAARAFSPATGSVPLHETLSVGLGLSRRPGASV